MNTRTFEDLHYHVASDMPDDDRAVIAAALDKIAGALRLAVEQNDFQATRERLASLASRFDLYAIAMRPDR